MQGDVEAAGDPQEDVMQAANEVTDSVDSDIADAPDLDDFHIEEHDGATVQDSQTVVVPQEIPSVSRSPDSAAQCQPQTQVPHNRQEDPQEKIQPAAPVEGPRQRLPGGRGSQAGAARPQERSPSTASSETPDRFL